MKRMTVSAALVLVFSCVPLCGRAAAAAPDKHAETAVLPEVHGIAVFGGTHHLRLLLALLEPSAETKALRTELNVTPELVPALTKVAAPPDPGDQGSARPITGRDDARQAVAGARRALGAMEENVLSRLPKTWSRRQQARFEELACQLSGPMALRFKHYAVRAGLSEAQRAKIKELVDADFTNSMGWGRAIFSAPSEAAAKSPQRRLNALARELDEKILATLTEKQRSEWQTLLGKKFDWESLKQAPTGAALP